MESVSSTLIQTTVAPASFGRWSGMPSTLLDKSVDELWMNITDTAYPTINTSLLMTTNMNPQSIL